MHDMSFHSPQCRSVLVDLANNSSNERLRYLSELPSDMLQTVDVAISVGDHVLPAHSFALMAVSKVFREVLSGQSHMFSTLKVLQIPMAGDTLREATSALKHMYKQLIPREKLNLGYTTAINLMRFWHKYDAEILFDQACNTLKYFCEKELHKGYGNLVPEAVLIKMVDITNAAEQVNQDLLDTCIAWFKDYICMCRLHDPDLYRLTKTTMLSILTENMSRRSKRLPNHPLCHVWSCLTTNDLRMTMLRVKQKSYQKLSCP